jgi:hypothetical protein
VTFRQVLDDHPAAAHNAAERILGDVPPLLCGLGDARVEPAAASPHSSDLATPSQRQRDEASTTLV